MTVWLWAGHLPSPSLIFFNCEMKIKTYLPYWFARKIKYLVMIFSGCGKSQQMLLSAHIPHAVKSSIFIHIEHLNQMPTETRQQKEKLCHLRNNRQAFAKKLRSVQWVPLPFLSLLSC